MQGCGTGARACAEGACASAQPLGWIASGQPAACVIAADAVVYVPDLAPLLSEISRVLTPRGLMALTVETHNGESVILGEKLRYPSGDPHVTASIITLAPGQRKIYQTTGGRLPVCFRSMSVTVRAL